MLRFTLGVLFLAACGSGYDLPDSGRSRDAALVDGGPGLDAGAIDASSDDAGMRWLCAPGDCDPRRPSCTGTSGSCVLWDQEPSCHSDVGTLHTGEACTQNDECGPSLGCFQTSAGGLCARVCCPGEDLLCDADETCGGSGILVDGTTTDWGRCLPTRSCDVLDPSSACEQREACYIVDASGRTECRVAGTAAVGDRCVLPQDCAEGLFCGGLLDRHCVRICRLGDECPAGEGRCVAQAHSPTGTGFCTIDMATARAR